MLCLHICKYKICSVQWLEKRGWELCQGNCLSPSSFMLALLLWGMGLSADLFGGTLLLFRDSDLSQRACRGLSGSLIIDACSFFMWASNAL